MQPTDQTKQAPQKSQRKPNLPGELNRLLKGTLSRENIQFKKPNLAESV